MVSVSPGLARFRRLDPSDRRRVCEAAIALTLAAPAVQLIPFRHTARSLRLRGAAQPPAPTAAQLQTAQSVGWAITAVAHRLPWHSTCLMQAVAASAMLTPRHVPQTLTLGIVKDDAGPAGYAAHAWLACGETVILGAGGSDRFTPVATFGAP